MARIRTVKPELFRHEELFEAEQESGLPLRLAFIGLFTVCDREGIFRWQPRQLKLDVMPYDSHEFSHVLDALTTRGFVIKYACGTDEYGVIPSFTRHQVINNKEKASVHPHIEHADYVFERDISNLATRDPRVIHASTSPLEQDQGEGKGREGKGKGKGKDGNSEHSESFEAFWRLYPNKKAKAKAEQLWMALKPNQELAELIMESLALQKSSPDWTKDGGKFIPHPTTWINQRRWEDECQMAPVTRHTGFNDRDYHAGLFEKEDGSYGF